MFFPPRHNLEKKKKKNFPVPWPSNSSDNHFMQLDLFSEQITFKCAEVVNSRENYPFQCQFGALCKTELC